MIDYRHVGKYGCHPVVRVTVRQGDSLKERFSKAKRIAQLYGTEVELVLDLCEKHESRRYLVDEDTEISDVFPGYGGKNGVTPQWQQHWKANKAKSDLAA